eukprot:gb/GEZJ01003999.1/.p2 GENE.gb/GEZJ01003999.1/~~gb/GEZJ01003999.1/.p2  ORF type:complete len:124 (+),score=5.48 gb/GEZJ01003999.1/:459-830(+)
MQPYGCNKRTVFLRRVHEGVQLERREKPSQARVDEKQVARKSATNSNQLWRRLVRALLRKVNVKNFVAIQNLSRRRRRRRQSLCDSDRERCEAVAKINKRATVVERAVGTRHGTSATRNASGG